MRDEIQTRATRFPVAAQRSSQEPDGRHRPQPEEGPLDILFEDDWMVAVNKQPGMVVHPTYKNSSGTLLNAVLWRFRNQPRVQPGILTRLDKDTSGLVIVALTPVVHARMQADAARGHAMKQYLAVVSGSPDPPAGRIDLRLARDPHDRRRVIVTDDGVACETRYEVLSSHGLRSVVLCQPVTGRTHQIRVHLAARGWPILGDAVYGQRDPAIARQALHAWRVTLPHPITRAILEIEAPVPADLVSAAGDCSTAHVW